MYCEKCGAWLRDGIKYCEQCGAPLATEPIRKNREQTQAHRPAAPEQEPQSGYSDGQNDYTRQDKYHQTNFEDAAPHASMRTSGGNALAWILVGALAVLSIVLVVLLLRLRDQRADIQTTPVEQVVPTAETQAEYPVQEDYPSQIVVEPAPDVGGEESDSAGDVVPPADEKVETPPPVEENDGPSSDEAFAEKKLEPFYGIWVAATEEIEYAFDLADQFRGYGLDAQVFLTTDWSNLNPLKYYVITIGTYASREEAEAMLPTVKTYVSNAYVKYTGDWQGD